jgi:O-antigen/teichoic acid export membrane protein
MAALVAIIVVFYKVGIPKIQWHWSINQLILKKSYPYALLILLMMMYSKMDTLMIERLHVDGLKQVGIYAQAYRLLDASFMSGLDEIFAESFRLATIEPVKVTAPMKTPIKISAW